MSKKKTEKQQLVEWLVAHLPGGPEMHLDRLPLIVASLHDNDLKFLRFLKHQRMMVEERQRQPMSSSSSPV